MINFNDLEEKLSKVVVSMIQSSGLMGEKNIYQSGWHAGDFDIREYSLNIEISPFIWTHSDDSHQLTYCLCYSLKAIPEKTEPYMSDVVLFQTRDVRVKCDIKDLIAQVNVSLLPLTPLQIRSSYEITRDNVKQHELALERVVASNRRHSYVTSTLSQTIKLD